MDAAAESDMRIGRSAGIDAVRIGEALAVAIGGAEQQADLVAAPQRNPVEIDILQRIAREEVKRRIEAQQFLHQRGGRRWRRKRLARIDARLQPRLDAVAHAMNSRLM